MLRTQTDNQNAMQQYSSDQAYQEASYNRENTLYNLGQQRASQGLQTMQQVNANLYNTGIQEKTANNTLAGALVKSLGTEWIQAKSSGNTGLAEDEINNQSLFIERRLNQRISQITKSAASATYRRGGRLTSADTGSLTIQSSPIQVGLQLARLNNVMSVALQKESMSTYRQAAMLATSIIKKLSTK